jgi:hypothetical protein
MTESGGIVRERGVQTRRVRPGDGEPQQRPDPAPRAGTNVWQVIAIIALLAATAGWTTVAVIAVRPATSAAVDNPVASDDPNAVDPSVAPVADSHDAPDLEALLPTELSGTPLQLQSWTGDVYLTDDSWSTSITSFLTSAGKTPPDFRVAQAYDATQALDGTVLVYTVAGIEPAKVRDALLAAWKGDFPDLKVSTLTLGGKEVTKGDFGSDAAATFLYLKGNAVYDIETSDEAIATTAIAAIDHPGASHAPAASDAPAASASPAP